MGESDDPVGRRGDDRELIATTEKTCPHDGDELVTDPVLWPGIGVTGSITQLRHCRRCGRRYSSSVMTDFIATLNDRMVPAWLRSYQTTLPRIESAQAETGKLEDKVDELQARLDRVQEELPAPNRAVAEVREELGGLEDRLGEMGRNWEEARKDFLGLIPDATDLAYMKLAKAEVTELRGLLTRHLEHDDRERGIKNSEAANRRAWAAIGIAGVGLVVSIIGTVFGR